MAGTTRTLPTSFNDTNSLRTFGSQFNADLIAGGLVKTNDSGQIDWNTIVGSNTDNSYVGYEIYRFNDTLQSSSPLFIKIRYGILYPYNPGSTYWRVQGPGGSPSCRFAISFGTSSNGSGGLTGTNSRAEVMFDCYGTTGGLTAVICAANNKLAFAVGTTSTSSCYSSFFTVERSKNSSGQDTSEGFVVWSTASCNYSNSPLKGEPQGMFIPADISTCLGVERCYINVPSNINTGVSGSNVKFYPVYTHYDGDLKLPGIGMLGYFIGDAGAGGTGVVPVYGVNRTYYFLPGTDNLIRNDINSKSNFGLAMLYE